MPKSVKITTTFSKNGRTIAQTTIGRNYGGVRSGDTAIAQAVGEELNNVVRSSSRGEFFRVKAPQLAQRIALEIDRELLKVGRFIGSSMIGRAGAVNDPGGVTTFTLDAPSNELNDIEVTWRNLTLGTLRRKSKNKPRFFLHEGELRQELTSKVGPSLVQMANAGVRRKARKEEVVYGPVRIVPVYNAGGSRIYRIASIDVNLFAGSRIDKLLPILRSTTFEGGFGNFDVKYLGRALGLSSRAIEKLLGPHGREQSVAYRPLLEPAIAYFLLNRVPGAVGRALDKYARRQF